jgi:5'-deoxynucleotidase YfbR-like HD superfamily hydrolase
MIPTGSNDSRIMLHSGRLFDLSNPETSEITIDDIAHGLSLTCRYAGQCSGFYSVAEHSVLVSHVATHAKLAALLHDAAEAYVGDMSRPLKLLLPDYKTIERRIEREIFLRVGIEWPPPPEVKLADHRLLAAEQAVLMPAGTNEWLCDTDIIPAEVEIRQLCPSEAKKLFLDRFAELNQAKKQVQASFSKRADQA